MKSFRKELSFELPTRRGFVNITRDVAAGVRESGVQEGFALVNAMHITASVLITVLTNRVCIRISTGGSKNWLRMNLCLTTNTTRRAKVMGTHI